MEIVLVVFLGVWLSLAGILAKVWLKKEYKPYFDEEIHQGGYENE